MIVVIVNMLQMLNIEHNLFWIQNIPLMTVSFPAACLDFKACPCQISIRSCLKSDTFPLLSLHEQVALVFPNNDPAAFMVAFYGCLLAEVVPVPIEVPLTRKVRLNIPQRESMNDCHIS